MYEIRHYLKSNGRDVFNEWLRSLRDRKVKAAILRRVNRLERGNFGDHKSCGKGVWELRIDTRGGYRIYYALTGKTMVLLLCGGDKASQYADIAAAQRYWHEWRERSP